MKNLRWYFDKKTYYFEKRKKLSEILFSFYSEILKFPQQKNANPLSPSQVMPIKKFKRIHYIFYPAWSAFSTRIGPIDIKVISHIQSYKNQSFAYINSLLLDEQEERKVVFMENTLRQYNLKIDDEVQCWEGFTSTTFSGPGPFFSPYSVSIWVWGGMFYRKKGSYSRIRN